LHYAAGEGHLEVVRSLLDARAEVDTEDDRYRQTQLRAARDGDLEVVRSLLDAHAKGILEVERLLRKRLRREKRDWVTDDDHHHHS
jgi:ankyrin repeat protein